MIRHVLPVAAILVLAAGCGGKREKEPETMRAESAPDPVAAPVAVVEPTVEKPRKKKKGEPEPVAAPVIAQPAAPDLPGDISLGTTLEMLSAQALIAAREQVEAGLSGQADVAQRHAFILAAWQPLCQARQSELAEIAAAREQRAQRGVANAKIVADHKQRLDAVDAEYEPLIRAERAKTVPILEQ